MTWHRLFAQPASWRPLVEGVAISFVFAWIASQLARAMVRGVLTSLLHDGVAPASHAVRALLRLFGYAIFAIVFALLLVPSLEFVGLHPRAGVHLRTLAAWAFDSGLRVLLICASRTQSSAWSASASPGSSTKSPSGPDSTRSSGRSVPKHWGRC